MLGEQFYENPKFRAYLDKNFVSFRADRDEKIGEEVFKKYDIRGTPTTIVLGGDGAEVDWILGYGPPAENFQAKLDKIIKGEDTFLSLGAAWAKNPKDAALAFKLARKHGDRLDQAKANELYKQVIALDPQGKSGTYTNEYTKVTVSYTQQAEFNLATSTGGGAKPDMTPVRAFIAKYPKSPLIKSAYMNMGYYYGYQATKEEAAKFFPEFAAKYPADTQVLGMWLSRIVKDKEPLDKGVELADQIQELTRYNPDPSTYQEIAELYYVKGDKAKADEIFGKSFMEGQVSNMAYNLISYANFWMEKDANKDSALAMGETALKLEPKNSYILAQVAGLFVKAGQEAKGLALFGPAYVQKNQADAASLSSYARFWAQQGKNLDSALAAAKKSVELKPGTYYFWSTLADVYSKMKKTPDAVKAAEKAVELAAEGPAKEAMKKNLEKIKNPQAPEKK